MKRPDDFYTPRPARKPDIDGGRKPSVKAPDPLNVTADEYAFVDGLSDAEIRSRLSQRDVPAQVVEDLIVDRETAGGRWRIAQEIFR